MLKEKKGAEKRRAAAAKARKEAAKAKAKAVVMREAREVPRTDDHYRREAEGPKSGSVKKRGESSVRRDEVTAGRAEDRKTAEQDDKEVQKNLLLKQLGREKVTKVAKAELHSRREQEQEAIRRKIEEKNSGITVEEEYKRMVLVKNTNKDESVIDAHTIDEAINQLSIADDYMKDPRLKALFKAFEEDQLPTLKEDKPGLSDSQYKNMILKLWKRSAYIGEKVSVVSRAQKNKEERKSRGKTLDLDSL